MEKKKLLRVLIGILLTTISISSNIAFAHGINDETNQLLKKLENTPAPKEQVEWAKDLQRQAKELTKETILQKLKELDEINEGNGLDVAQVHNNRAVLKVFVSTSMPISLLKSYHKQVVKFNGTLVFKGLPGGSFNELANIVTAISENGEAGSMQIDDEAFERFGIKAAPAILLIKEEDCFDGQSCKVTYDKLTGSLGVKPALEKFVEDGDLSEEAKELLGQ